MTAQPPRLTAGGWEQRCFPPFTDQLADPQGICNEWLEKLAIKPISAIEWHLAPFFRQGPRVAADVNWMWIMRGRGEIIVGREEQAVQVETGDSIFIRPGTRHIEYFPSGHRWSCVSIHFLAVLFGSVDFLSMAGFPLVIRAKSGGGLGAAARRLAREFALRPPGWYGAMAAEIRLALLHAVRHLGPDFKPASQPGFGPAATRLLPVTKMIAENLGHAELGIPDLARAAGLSAARFRAVFKSWSGHSPVHYIHQRRIEEACRLLRQTDMPIKAIGVACGFRAEPFFYRIFRRLTGATPKEYRENNDV